MKGLRADDMQERGPVGAAPKMLLFEAAKVVAEMTLLTGPKEARPSACVTERQGRRRGSSRQGGSGYRGRKSA